MFIVQKNGFSFCFDGKKKKYKVLISFGNIFYRFDMSNVLVIVLLFKVAPISTNR